MPFFWRIARVMKTSCRQTARIRRLKVKQPRSGSQFAALMRWRVVFCARRTLSAHFSLAACRCTGSWLFDFQPSGVSTMGRPHCASSRGVWLPSTSMLCTARTRCRKNRRTVGHPSDRATKPSGTARCLRERSRREPESTSDGGPITMGAKTAD